MSIISRRGIAAVGVAAAAIILGCLQGHEHGLVNPGPGGSQITS